MIDFLKNNVAGTIIALTAITTAIYKVFSMWESMRKKVDAISFNREKIEALDNADAKILELVTKQQEQIKEVNERLEKGNVKFESFERELQKMNTDILNYDQLMKNVNDRLDFLVEIALGVQSDEKITIMKSVYNEKQKKRLDKGE